MDVNNNYSGHSREDIDTGAAQPPDSPLGTRPTSREAMVNAASEVVVGPLTLFSLPTNCKRNAKNSVTTSSSHSLA